MNITLTHPNLLKEWDYEKNDILPETLTHGSKIKVWWKCNVATDHCWEASILNRVKGTKCPCCTNRKCVPSNCLATTHPGLSKEWSIKNTILPFEITKGYNKKVFWKCINCSNEWESQVIARTRRGDGCPFCAGQKATKNKNFAKLYPELLLEWDYNKNTIHPENLLPNSMKKVWWICKKDETHKWKTTLNNRVSKKHPCPFCVGKKADSKTSLFAKYPDICIEWDYDKNTINPKDILPNSHKNVWWICKIDETHKWKTNPNNRISSSSRCPYCFSSAGEKLVKMYLEEFDINYKREYKIGECKNKRALPFDFAIHKNTLHLIEFQGQQHYFPSEYYGGEKGFLYRIKNDQIKRDYCNKNNIPLLEIRYDQTHLIPSMINEFLIHKK